MARLRSERDAAAAELQKLKELISQGKPPRQKEGPRKTHRGVRAMKAHNG